MTLKTITVIFLRDTQEISMSLDRQGLTTNSDDLCQIFPGELNVIADVNEIVKKYRDNMPKVK